MPQDQFPGFAPGYWLNAAYYLGEEEMKLQGIPGQLGSGCTEIAKSLEQ
jgi:hypothetical protein